MDEKLNDTLNQIEKRIYEESQKPWCCRRCQKEQPPPRPPELLCGSCVGEAVKEAKAQRLGRIDDLLAEYGVPVRFTRWAKPKPGTEWIEQYALDPPRGLFLLGTVGSGKSVACALVIRRWLTRWAKADQLVLAEPSRAWRFVNCTDLTMQLQDSWRREDSDHTAYRMLKSLAQTERLVLDDIASENTTQYVRQAIYFLINEREQWERFTIITSNLSLAQIDRQYDSRISSRIAGMCDVIELKGKDGRIHGTAR